MVDPVLYVHPRFAGSLPAGLLQLEGRSLNAEGIARKAAEIHNVLDEMQFVKLN